MAFTDFTSIAQVQETFDIKYMEEDYIQYNVDIEPSPAFLEEFTNLPPNTQLVPSPQGDKSPDYAPKFCQSHPFP